MVEVEIDRMRHAGVVTGFDRVDWRYGLRLETRARNSPRVRRVLMEGALATRLLKALDSLLLPFRERCHLKTSNSIYAPQTMLTLHLQSTGQPKFALNASRNLELATYRVNRLVAPPSLTGQL